MSRIFVDLSKNQEIKKDFYSQLETFIAQKDLVFVRYKYDKKESTLDDMIESYSCFQRLKEYLEKNSFTNVQINHKDNIITASRPITDKEKQLAEVYKMNLYLNKYKERVKEINNQITSVSKDLEENESQMNLLKAAFSLRELNQIDLKSKDANKNIEKPTSLLKVCSDLFKFENIKSITQKDKKEIDLLNRMRIKENQIQRLNSCLHFQSQLVKYKEKHFFTNMRNNLLEDYGRGGYGNGFYVPTNSVGFEYLELHLKTIIFKHPVSLKACSDFIVENNIVESIETKQLLGIK